MYSKISEDTYRKLIDKLVKIPYVTGAHATHAIFGDGIEVAFQCPYMGKMFEYYLVADSQHNGKRSYRWWRSIHGFGRALDFRRRGMHSRGFAVAQAGIVER